MNKIFKVIWNKTTQSLVVTSELARGAVKSSSDSNSESKSSLGKIFKLSALSLLLLDVTSTAYAASSAPPGAGDGKNEAIALGLRTSASPGSVVIGAGSIATGNIKGVAIGHTVLTNGQDAVAIGSNSQAVTQGAALGRLANAGSSATALGNQATASGEKSIAAGNQATASGLSSVAAGDGANAKSQASVAIGQNATVEREKGIAIGENATATTNSTNAIAIGVSSVSNGTNSTAIGTNARGGYVDSVALGTAANASNYDFRYGHRYESEYWWMGSECHCNWY